MSRTPAPERPWPVLARRPSARLAGTVLAVAWGAFLVVVCTLWARAVLHRSFLDLDDEGYVLVAQRSFLRGGALYDEVFSQYGPFFHELFAVPAWLLGVATDHAFSRAATAVTWVACAAVLGLAVARSRRSAYAGALAFALAAIAFESLQAEPMHPHGIGWLLLGCVLLLAPGDAHAIGPRAAFGIGVALAALTLTKVNLGAYAALGLGLALAGSSTSPRRGGSARAAIAWATLAWTGAIAACVGMLVSAGGLEILRGYAAYLAGVLAALAVVARARGGALETTRPAVRAFVLGVVATAIVVLGALFLGGTSLAGAWHGLVGQHARLVESTTSPDLPPGTGVLVAFSLACAIGWSVQARRGRVGARLDAFVAAATLAWSVATIVATIDARCYDLLGYSAPFLWLPLACPRSRAAADDASSERELPPPTVLACLAAFQLLQPFPGGGTHVYWAVLLLGPLAAHALHQSVAWARARSSSRRSRTIATTLAMVVMVAVGGLVSDVLWRGMRFARSIETVDVPLDLPGSGDLRVTEEQAAFARWMTATARASDAFYSFPGRNSLYVWSDRYPPTMLNLTFVLRLLRDEEQERVVGALAANRRLTVLLDTRSEHFLFWQEEARSMPIARFVREECRRVARWDTDLLYARNGWDPEWTACARWEGGELVLRTDAAIPETAAGGPVSALEVLDLKSRAVIGRTDATDESGFELLDGARKPIDLRERPVFERAAEVHLVLRTPSRLEKVVKAKRAVVRALDAHGHLLRVYPVLASTTE